MQAAPYQSCSQSQYFKDFGCFFLGRGNTNLGQLLTLLCISKKYWIFVGKKANLGLPQCGLS